MLESPLINLYVVKITFYLTLLFGVLIALEKIKERKRIRLKLDFAFVFILFISSFMRFILVPHFNSIYTDELGYIMNAKKILEGNLAYNSRLGHPLINSLFFKLFGVNKIIPTYVSSFFDVLSCVVVFFLSLDLFNSHKIALVSMLIYSFSPLHLYLSGIGNTEAISNFFFLFSIYSFQRVARIKRKEWKLVLFTLFLTLFSIQFRVESSVIPVIQFAYVMLFFSRLNEVKKSLLILFLALLFLLFYKTFVVTQDFNVPPENKLFSPSYFLTYGGVYLSQVRSWFGNIIHAILYFLVLSFPLLNREMKFLVIWFLTIYVGVISYLSPSDRMLVSSFAVVPLIIGGFLKMTKSSVSLMLILLLILLELQPKVIDVVNGKIDIESETIDYKVLETYSTEDIERILPTNCTIISSFPDVFLRDDLHVLPIELVADSEFIKNRMGGFASYVKYPNNTERLNYLINLLENNECVVFFRDVCCERCLGSCGSVYQNHTDPEVRVLYACLAEKFACEFLDECFYKSKIKDFRFRGWNFVLYNLTGFKCRPNFYLNYTKK